jgi:large subunit ribosomal protein L19
MKTIEEINQHKVKKILTEKKIPKFFPGDVVKVGVRITEGKKERIQYFEGVCIARKNRDLNSSFTVRKISFGEGVERTFPLYGTLIDSIKVIRSGKVRRAKLYYLRDLTGKKARIVERMRSKQPDLASLFISENDEVLEEEYLTEEASSEESNDENTEANDAEAEQSDLEETTQEEKTEDKAEELKD